MTVINGMCDRTEKRHIFLTGFMGTGKSCVGKILATSLGRRFHDLDEIVVAGAGMPVVEIFARHGESAFREMEQDALKRVASEEPLVVATGGGAVINADNRLFMHDAGVVVNMTASAEMISERVAEDKGRPLLNGDKSVVKIARMLAEREPYYADADVRIDTNGKDLHDVAAEILVWLKNQCGDNTCQ